MGTDGDGNKATSYAVNWGLSGPTEKSGTIADQSKASAVFAISGLEAGDYTCNVSVSNAFGRVSSTKAVDFTIVEIESGLWVFVQ